MPTAAAERAVTVGATQDELPRHALVWIDAAAWHAVMAHRPDLADEPFLSDWAPKWPLIARRRLADDEPATVPLGLPLPPSHGKRRIALAVTPDAVRAVEPPPALVAARHGAPDIWRPIIERVLALGVTSRCQPRVYGSFAWASLTGLAYIGPFSDLDLLWPVTADSDIDALLRGLAAIEADAPARLDGELLIGTAQMGVHWRELHRGGDVLVKTTRAAILRPAAWIRQMQGV